jgi:hypothetical protein
MPRPRIKDIGGSVLGGLVGGMIAGVPGALLGGVLGSDANTNRPMPLDTALSKALADRKLALGGVTRDARNSVTVVFYSSPHEYWWIVSEVFIDPSWTADDLDDALYDATVAQFDSWAAAHGR